MIRIQVQTDDFDVGYEYRQLIQERPEAGAVVFFVGLVRDMNLGDQVNELQLEHYPGMTERALETIAADAVERWGLLDVRIIHRVGALAVQDQIVFVAVSSQHRDAAFSACDFLMDYLKSRAPFWKKERCRKIGEQAWEERWIDPVEKDQQAIQRWNNVS